MKKIVIVGGGIIGLLSALVSAKHNHKVIILNERKTPPKIPYLERYFAINLLSKHVLMNLGIWNGISQKCINPFNKIIAWDSVAKSVVTFNSQSISYDYLGYVIKESEMIKSLLDAIKQKQNIIYKKNVILNDIQDKPNNYSITYNNEKLNFDVLIAADGKLSKVVKILKLDNNLRSYNQDALVMNVKFAYRDAEKISYQRFNNGDVQGLLPIGDNTYNLIWSTSHSNSEKLIKLHKKDLIKILNQDLSSYISEVSSVSKISKFPLTHSHLKSNVIGNIIFIGDAAHTIHPLAGLGLNMGIQDVFVLDISLEKSSESPNHMDSNFLRYYGELCNTQNKKIMNTINFLKKFYETTFIPSVIKKSLVGIFNDNALLKSRIIQEATGIYTLRNLSSRNYYQTHY